MERHTHISLSLFSPPKLSTDAKKVPSPLGRRCHEVADEGYGIVSSENKIPHPALSQEERENHFGGLKRHLSFNPDFAIAHGIRRRRPDVFFLKKFVHATSRACTFFVETASASFVSVLASMAKSGFNKGLYTF